jgi:hypothetical protein
MPPRTPREQVGVDLPERDPLPEPEPQISETIEETGRPAWVPEKFESPEAFVQSYTEMESRLTREAQDRAALEQRLDTMEQLLSQGYGQPQSPAQQAYQPDPNEVNAQLQAAYEANPLGTIAFLAQQAAGAIVEQRMGEMQAAQQPMMVSNQRAQGELVAAQAQQILRGRYADWDRYADTVGSVIERNPNLLTVDTLQSLDATANTLEAIYKQLRYDEMQAQIANGSFQLPEPNGGNGNGSDNGQAKRMAQSLSGGAGRPSEPSELDELMAGMQRSLRGASWSAFRGAN